MDKIDELIESCAKRNMVFCPYCVEFETCPLQQKKFQAMTGWEDRQKEIIENARPTIIDTEVWDEIDDRETD